MPENQNPEATMESNRYLALSDFCMLCGFLKWLALVSGIIGAGWSIWWMNPQHPLDGWMFPTLLASIVGGVFWFFAFRALVAFIDMQIERTETMRQLLDAFLKARPS